MWLMYHWLCWVTEKPHHHPPSPPLFPPTCKCTRQRKEREEREERGSREVKGRGSMQVYDNTQTDALVENSLNCEQRRLPGIQESKYQLIRGSRWKKGRCEMRFMLSCFCIYASCKDLSSSHYSLPTVALAALCLWRYGLNNLHRLKSVSVTLGVTAGKKLIRLCPIPSRSLFVPWPLKSFVLFCSIDYILSMNKSWQKTNTLKWI